MKGIPQVNMNGNTREDLVAQLVRTRNSVQIAIGDLKRCDYYHGRNFQTYTNAAEVTMLAREEHVTRLLKLEEVSRELLELAMAIDSQC
jgi:hypothetical protein